MEPESGNFGQVQKLPNLVTFGLEIIPFMATSRFCQFWQNLAVAMLPNVATLKWHKSFKSGYFKHLPTLAIPIISNQVAKYGNFGKTSIIQFWLLQAFAFSVNINRMTSIPLMDCKIGKYISAIDQNP